MNFDTYLLIAALIVAFYTAWNIGANDVANAMGTSVGSKALTLIQAVVIASIFEFLGAVLFGSNVSATLEKGLINAEVLSDRPNALVFGMLSALLATGLWLQLASYLGLPVSTTHAIVGAIVGFGSVIGGMDAIYWDTVWSIAGSWIGSPLLGAVLSYIIFLLIRRRIFYQLHPLAAIKKYLPYIVGSVIFVLSLIVIKKVFLKEASPFFVLLLGLLLAAAFGFLTFSFSKRISINVPTVINSQIDPNLLIEVEQARRHLLRVQKATQGEINYQLGDLLQEIEGVSFAMRQVGQAETKHTEFYWVERIFGYLQIASACMMAFAHGSNDVSNAMGPLAAILGHIGFSKENGNFPTWILVLGGVGIVTGLATWGWRVIETIGKKITELTPSRGFSAEFGAACSILAASAFGFPVSTTHTLVGAVLGVGLAGGLGAINLATIRDIMLSWIITIPAGALLSICCYYLIDSASRFIL